MDISIDIIAWGARGMTDHDYCFAAPELYKASQPLLPEQEKEEVKDKIWSSLVVVLVVVFLAWATDYIGWA